MCFFTNCRQNASHQNEILKPPPWTQKISFGQEQRKIKKFF